MAKLILSMDGLVLKEITLNKERTTIGRKPHNDIQIDNLAVSGEHAVIVTILNDCFLEDLGSTNGTSVNGQPIKKHFLQHNDVIELGKYKLKFVNERAVPAGQADDFEKTMVLSPNQPIPAGALAAAPASSAAERVNTSRAAPEVPAITSSQPLRPLTESQAMRVQAASPPDVRDGVDRLAAIQVLSGQAIGRELLLTKTLTTVGATGRQVAVIARRAHGYFITHVEGDHSPVVNGVPIGAAAHALEDRDVIELAGVKMEFFYKR